MNCREIEPLIYMVGEGELTDHEKARVLEHLAGCEHCRKLTESVKNITGIAGKLDFGKVNFDTDERVIKSVMKVIESPGTGARLIAIRYMAAAILLFLASVFIYQEYVFHNYRQTLQTRIHKLTVQKRVLPPAPDCVDNLKRKIKVRSKGLFSERETLLFARITEEEMIQYINKMCGPDQADIHRVKRLLMQAGLIQDNLTEQQIDQP